MALPLIGGTGRRKGFASTGPKEEDEVYEPTQPEEVNRSFQGKVRVIKSQDRRRAASE